MKHLFFLSILILIVVVFLSCGDQMQEVMKPIAEDVIGDPVTEPEYADVPLIDVPELEPGLYRINVTSGHVSNNYVDSLGTLPMPENENVLVAVHLYPVVEDFSYDHFLDAQVVVRIYAKDITPPFIDDTGTTYHIYHGSVINVFKKTENSEIVYAHAPPSEADLPVLQTAFAGGSVEPGRYLMFIDGYDYDPETDRLTGVYCDTDEENVFIRVILEKQPNLNKKDDTFIFSRSLAVIVDVGEPLGVRTETIDGVTYTSHDYSGVAVDIFGDPGALVYDE